MTCHSDAMASITIPKTTTQVEGTTMITPDIPKIYVSRRHMAPYIQGTVLPHMLCWRDCLTKAYAGGLTR
jgi:hypothetical protein